jgi:cytoskeletal protein RodZ
MSEEIMGVEEQKAENPKIQKANPAIQVGKQLRAARLKQHLRLDQVAKELRIKKIYLEAIEKGDLQAIPFKVYLLGYIKQYASYLDIAPELLIKQLKGIEVENKSISFADVWRSDKFLPSANILCGSILIMLMLYIAL